VTLRVLLQAVVLGLVAVLAACAPGSVAVAPSPPPIPQKRPPLLLGLPCLDQLARLGGVYEMVAERAGGQCTLTNGINLAQSTIPLERPATMTCSLAVALADFEQRVVQPAAEKYFKQRVILIRHFGAFECRNVRGTRRVSEHGRGLALDISGFDLEDGRRINVKDHWRAAGAPSRFLQEIAQDACGLFNVVLTPKSDADHHDHLHVDLGRATHCGA
jgi:hypothetical protein